MQYNPVLLASAAGLPPDAPARVLFVLEGEEGDFSDDEPDSGPQSPSSGNRTSTPTRDIPLPLPTGEPGEQLDNEKMFAMAENMRQIKRKRMGLRSRSRSPGKERGSLVLRSGVPANVGPLATLAASGKSESLSPRSIAAATRPISQQSSPARRPGGGAPQTVQPQAVGSPPPPQRFVSATSLSVPSTPVQPSSTAKVYPQSLASFSPYFRPLTSPLSPSSLLNSRKRPVD